MKEFTQLNEGAVSGKPVVIPTDATTITSLEKKKVLRAVNLIQEKRSGDLKVRTCVDGSGQKTFETGRIGGVTSSIIRVIDYILISRCL